ncbi:MAG TPA: 30S ribosome-binding factor RbfA [Steroidobacteraceae bacterium]|jgi:ribosome-binding factor A|nr:30S ribosome-binding factor RbfA [Steroidobacteraceae bacterium]
MSESRHLKVEAQLQRVLAELVSREVKDPRVGNVTISAVSVAPDLKTARVFFVPFGTSHSAEEVREGLTHAAGFLRGAAARRLALRYAPRLHFVFDESFDRADRLANLIASASEPGSRSQ